MEESMKPREKQDLFYITQLASTLVKSIHAVINTSMAMMAMDHITCSHHIFIHKNHYMN